VVVGIVLLLGIRVAILNDHFMDSL